MSKENKKVLLGMSGGVDSSVSATLLLEQGYDVIGAFMKNWSDCQWRADQRDATRVAAKLNIPFVTFDFEKEYRRDVVDYLFLESQAGRTPNPDVMCNKFIKFDLFVKEANRLGCDFVATGHYARIVSSSENRSTTIARGIDANKDQSYFLWAVNPDVLDRVLFPIGEMTKTDVRKKAHELGLAVADKKDSVGICFVGEVDMVEFLKSRIPESPGPIVTVDEQAIGEHDGLPFYTIGQRKGLGIGGGTPYYIVDKRPRTNELVVSSNYHPSLYKKNLTATHLNMFAQGDRFSTTTKCQARIRYRQTVQACVVKQLDHDRVQIEFDKPQRAVTPGQSIVFYDGEIMLGGGIIE